MINENVLNAAREKLAAFFKDRRIELGKTQEQLADEIGASRNFIIRFEQAKFFPRFSQYLSLCEALHLFPAIVEMESNTPIAEAFRQNWNPNHKAMTIEEAIKLKNKRHNRDGQQN